MSSGWNSAASRRGTQAETEAAQFDPESEASEIDVILASGHAESISEPAGTSQGVSEGTPAQAVDHAIQVAQNDRRSCPRSNLAPSVEYFQAGQPFESAILAVSPFTIPHDAADPVGFVFRAEGVRMAVATDLGYIPPNVKAQLKDLDLLLLESNHIWRCCATALTLVGQAAGAFSGGPFVQRGAAEFLENQYDGQAA